VEVTGATNSLIRELRAGPHVATAITLTTLYKERNYFDNKIRENTHYWAFWAFVPIQYALLFVCFMGNIIIIILITIINGSAVLLLDFGRFFSFLFPYKISRLNCNIAIPHNSGH
jgi:hypothetical protein